ncbi:ribonuclease D [Alteromonas sediminis]|uniref:ribonuclease D n=1 Tax=Alteromonas sediminis TaxID=2259342 RepID=UPI001F0CCEF7|nr:ribonuclease D [Alteromonas sediminis]
MTDYIDSDEQLIKVCERASKRAFVILDTEFVRTKTLTPLLGLIQLNDGEHVSLIDPLALSDMSPFKTLLRNEKCVKVLHACSEDLEAFLASFGVVPAPVFDTQFAAHLTGIGTTMGYANLIEQLLGIVLDKGESRTDWLARPLSLRQCEYAANDVIHLLPAYNIILEKLTPEQVNIVYAESALIAEKKKAQLPDDFAYLTVKNAWRLNGKQRFVLRALAKWRIERARAKNMALNFVLREGAMLNIATYLPQSKTALAKIHGLTPMENRMVGAAVLQIVADALKDFETRGEQQGVPPVKRLSEIKTYKSVMAQLKQCVDGIAAETGIPSEILSSKKQLHQLLKFSWFDIDETRLQNLKPDVLSGWRKPLFEDKIHAILEQVAKQ